MPNRHTRMYCRMDARPGGHDATQDRSDRDILLPITPESYGRSKLAHPMLRSYLDVGGRTGPETQRNRAANNSHTA